MVRLTNRPDMALDVYRGRKTTIQQVKQNLRTSKVTYVSTTWYPLSASGPLLGHCIHVIKKTHLRQIYPITNIHVVK